VTLLTLIHTHTHTHTHTRVNSERANVSVCCLWQLSDALPQHKTLRSQSLSNPLHILPLYFNTKQIIVSIFQK